MKHRKLIIAGTLGALLACGGDSPVAPPGDGGLGDASPTTKADTLILSRTSITVGNGDWVYLTARAMSAGTPIAGKKITWQVGNERIAIASVLGDTIVSVWGTGVGSTTISATADGKTSRVSVIVTPAVAAYLFITPGVLAVEEGTTRTLGLLALTAGYKDVKGSAAWSSSDSTTVSVSSSGIATARKAGTAIISVRMDTLTATATVHVPSPFVRLSASYDHTCGLKADGRAFCWGANSGGQLGDGTLIQRSSAVQVKTDQKFKSIAFGFGDCGLTAGGELYCWGNAYQSSVPVRLDSPGGFVTLVGGFGHTCALNTSGEAYCWGSGYATGAGVGVQRVPVRAAPLLTFQSLAAGYQFTCGLTVAGKAYCWGVNDYGQLGDSTPGKTIGAGRSEPLPVAGNNVFTVLKSGSGSRSICGLTGSGDAYCWGSYVEDNAAATTADCATYSTSKPTAIVTVRCSPVPVKVSGGVRFKDIATAADGQCGIEVGGSVFCWGHYYVSETWTVIPHPVAIGSTISFSSLTLGEFHYCGIASSGMAYCWGDNRDGEVGDYSDVVIKAGEYWIAPRYVVPAPALVASP